jgi:hypothetical protein
MLEVLRCSKMSISTTATRRNIPEDDIIHIQYREIIKSYTDVMGLYISDRNISLPDEIGPFAI